MEGHVTCASADVEGREGEATRRISRHFSIGKIAKLRDSPTRRVYEKAPFNIEALFPLDFPS